MMTIRPFWAILGLIWLALGAFWLYTAGQLSVRRSAYVQFYPKTASGWGPYMGECLHTADGIYCPQQRQ